MLAIAFQDMLSVIDECLAVILKADIFYSPYTDDQNVWKDETESPPNMEAKNRGLSHLPIFPITYIKLKKYLLVFRQLHS